MYRAYNLTTVTQSLVTKNVLLMHCKHKKIGWIFDQNLDHSLLNYKNDEQIACGDLYPKTLTNSINWNLFEYP